MNHTVDIECGITLLTFPRPTKKKKSVNTTNRDTGVSILVKENLMGQNQYLKTNESLRV